MADQTESFSAHPLPSRMGITPPFWNGGGPVMWVRYSRRCSLNRASTSPVTSSSAFRMIGCRGV